MMANGRIVLDGSVREIKRSFGRDTVGLEFEGPSTFLERMQDAGLIKVVSRTHHAADVRLCPGTPARDVLDAALREVDTLYRFEVVEPSLNEIFISVAGSVSAPASSKTVEA
jgi:ABC-2 type transport system ATP-binding protein